MGSSVDTGKHNLTQSQQLLWTGQELNPEVPLYNVAFTFRIRGSIQLDIFTRAFNLVVAESDALRTTFSMVNGVPQQQVIYMPDGGLSFFDWSAGKGNVSNLKQWIEDRIKQMFDLSKPCFESCLIKLTEDQYIWYFNQHHLITDAWSVSVLYKSLVGSYKLLKSGNIGTPDMPKFSNYLEFERRSKQEPVFEQALSYWEGKIQYTPPPPHLYGHSQQVFNTGSKRILLDLGPDRSNKLRELVREPDLRAWTEPLSLFNVFATLLFVYLHRASGQQRLALGAPAHNRINQLFKKTPGVFIEMFPIFMNLQEHESFVTVHSRVRNEVNDYLRFSVPGATSAEINRSFHVVMNYIHAEFGNFDGLPVEFDWIHSGHADPRHQLRLHIHDFDATGSINLHFDFNVQVFDEHQMQTAPNHFLRLLDAFLADRDQPIGKPRMTGSSEFRLISQGLNTRTLTDHPQGTVLDRFKSQVNSEPDLPVIVEGKQRLTFDVLDRKSNQLARFLIGKGTGPGKKVVLMLNRSTELIIGILGVLKSGAAFIPVDPNFPPERVKYILEDLDGPMVLTAQELQDIHNTGKLPDDSLNIEVDPASLAYLIYTSGTSGTPKGVMISHGALNNYIQWAEGTYLNGNKFTFALFTTPSFDLTITSIFLPLVSGGQLMIYPEAQTGPDLALLDVVKDNRVDIIKLTPSHLGLLDEEMVRNLRIKKLIVGGEDLKSGPAKNVINWFGENIEIYNEYGPTESTVGSIVHRFTLQDLEKASIPIGKPIDNTTVYLLDSHLNPVPRGVIGEIYISGAGLADGYWNRPDLYRDRFLNCPFVPGTSMYATGDRGRLNQQMDLEYSGRTDRQVKIGGIRVELGEIEAAMSQHPDIQQPAVFLQQQTQVSDLPVTHCRECGLPSNYPGVKFEESGICDICRSFSQYKKQVEQYFREEHQLKKVINDHIKDAGGEYHCLVLLSGGKDSTYALARLVDMGYNILAFTLDNGYISDQAKANINRVVKSLKVDHIFGKTESMNAIFVDSLNRHRNVCNGCFKTIYTLSTNLAVAKGIPVIVTGLSRGQLFETRLTEELFREQNINADKIDDMILQARKAYHQNDDAVNRLLDVSVFKDDQVFERVHYLDFYRYCEVSLDQMMSYLDQYLPWIRPSDTGRSTNCMINQVGIYVHRKQNGYSNYAFPYSWDVRLGHKAREAALAEVNEEIDEKEVFRIMDEIGYRAFENSGTAQQLAACYVGPKDITELELRHFLSPHLPQYMIPTRIRKLEKLPLTGNGKIDYQALSALTEEQVNLSSSYQAPTTQIEYMLAELWEEVLQLPKVGIKDNFLHLGGNSIIAIRLISRINEQFHLDLPLNKVFEFPTIADFGELIEETITKLLESET